MLLWIAVEAEVVPKKFPSDTKSFLFIFYLSTKKTWACKNYGYETWSYNLANVEYEWPVSHLKVLFWCNVVLSAEGTYKE